MTSVAQTAIEIKVAPERLFGLIANPEQLVRWHPAVDRVHWIEPVETIGVGDRFELVNVGARFDWATEVCEVTEYEPPGLFSFVILRERRAIAQWRYLVEASPDGSVVTAEHARLHEPFPDWAARVLGLRRPDAERVLEVALESLKTLAET